MSDALEIRRGDIDTYRDAQWWLGIESIAQYRILSERRLTEREIRTFIRSGAEAFDGVLCWDRRVTLNV